jgi:hypothetical protein
MKSMFRALLLAAMSLPAFAQSPSELIGTIDFYGYGDLDLAALRAILPFRVGDKLPSDAVQEAVVRAVGKAAGREAVVSGGCCLRDGRSTLFIGLAEPGSSPIRYNPPPHGNLKLPADAMTFFEQLEEHLFDAVKKGNATEDDSQGYALVNDPATRADQLKLRDWARTNTKMVLQVLAGSRDALSRSRAAEALGYADRSPQQIAALVEAAFDSDDGVRNNAIRALEVLCAIGTEVTGQIPAARFLPLLHSLTWTDRNKGSLLFVQMTASRDPALLKLLRDEALAPLREMAQWKDQGHAWAGLMILGRIAGIEESRLQQHMDPAEILKATRPAPGPKTSPARE